MFIRLLVLIIPFFIFSCNQEELIVDESFEYPDGDLPAIWWSEGSPAKIRNERLYVDADTGPNKASTVWLDKEFGGDFSIEFDVHVIFSDNKANNINTFLLYSHPEDKSLRKTKQERADGKYTHYHSLNGYIVTYVASGNEMNARTRLRVNPGFNLLEEQFNYECRQGKTYHFEIIKTENRIQFYVDGNKIIDRTDDALNLHKTGLFGFRTWSTALWWDNLVIKQLNI